MLDALTTEDLIPAQQQICLTLCDIMEVAGYEDAILEWDDLAGEPSPII